MENSLNPRVCILLCTYNGERYLNQQIESIMQQEFSNWVICASDDGSVDSTKSILKKYQDRIGKDKFHIFDGPKRGYPYNFKFAATALKQHFDYYAFCDQDDIWLPHKLDVGTKALTSLQNASYVTSMPMLYASVTNIVDGNNLFLRCSSIRRAPSFAHSLVENISGGNTMVFNRALWELFIGLPNHLELISHDWMAYQLVAGAGGIVHYDTTPSINYRQHSDNKLGTKFSLKGKVDRLFRFLKLEYKREIDINIGALITQVKYFTPSNQVLLRRFKAFRQGGIVRRLLYMIDTQFIRTSFIENLILKFGNLFKLM
jgi:glycosyltransferase involved in cell wall biosynthesis